MDDFLFLMKNGSCENFQSQLKRDFTAVIFLRHLGCGMSQLDMLKYRDAYHFLKDQGIEIMMVIQGAEAAVSERTAKMNIPFTVIADPEQPCMSTLISLHRTRCAILFTAFPKKNCWNSNTMGLNVNVLRAMNCNCRRQSSWTEKGRLF